MMRKALYALLVVFTGTGLVCAAGRSDGQQTEYGRFNAVEIRIPAETRLVKGDSFSVEASIPERYREDVVIENRRGTLVIGSVGNSFRLRRGDQIRFVITMPELERLQVIASGHLYSTDSWSGTEMEVASTGSATVELGDLEADSLRLWVTGSGTLRSGDITTRNGITMEVTGSGDVFTDTISSPELQVYLTGSGGLRAALDVAELDISQAGSGSAVLRGRAEHAAIRITGSGSCNGPDLRIGTVSILISGSGDIHVAPGAEVTDMTVVGSGRFSQR